MIKNSSHVISTEYQIMCFFDLFRLSRWQVLTISKIELSKSGICSEAEHRKLKFKVPSTNICNKTCWYRSPSVCDELLKLTDFAGFSSWIRLLPIECQTRWCYISSNRTNSLPNWPVSVPNDWRGQQSAFGWFFFSWNANVKLIAVGPAETWDDEIWSVFGRK